MAGFLERDPNPEQQEILNDFPFLEIYTNPQFAAYEHKHWVDALATQSRPLLASLEAKITHLGADALLNSMERMTRTIGLFDEDNSECQVRTETTYLLLLGFGLKEVEPILEMFPIIAESIQDRFIIRNRYLTSGGELNGGAKTAIAQIMLAGAEIARTPIHTSEEHYGINLQSAGENNLFEQFIEENLSGLDEL